MTSLELDPAIAKLIEYAKVKKVLNWDELNELLPETILNSEKMDQVLVLLEQNKVQILEEEIVLDEENEQEEGEEAKQEDGERKKLVYN